MRVRIEVHLKKGVTDPEGDNVLKALNLLGFKGIRGVHSAKLFLIDLDANDTPHARASAEEMCKRLLANPVVHGYTITVEGGEPAASGAATPTPLRRNRGARPHA
ncbi:MAG TPA: phosphoribosylformylglycinamidine synthase subunit PurS [Thermoplasmata archaeon]|nr:phosphoribosylformylglycinamidine synthase subunit PurS [Thermoplasmata archaeon]